MRSCSTRDVVLPALVDKCLGSTRAGTRKAALEATLFYIEMEDVMGSEGAVVSACAFVRLGLRLTLLRSLTC
jgi:hypothetical protein